MNTLLDFVGLLKGQNLLSLAGFVPKGACSPHSRLVSFTELSASLPCVSRILSKPFAFIPCLCFFGRLLLHLTDTDGWNRATTERIVCKGSKSTLMLPLT